MKKLFIFIFLISAFLISDDKLITPSGDVFEIYTSYINDYPGLKIIHKKGEEIINIANIPGTEDEFCELYPKFIYSSKTQEFFIVYSKVNINGADVYLQVMKKEGYIFSSPYKISESENTFCINPKIYQTYKIYFTENNERKVLKLLHIIWWEVGTNEQAVYLNIPITEEGIDLNFKTIIYLNDIIYLNENIKEISHYFLENPEIIISRSNENKLTLIFAHKKSSSYVLLDLSYENEKLLRDRAHFPDIGIRAIIEIPNEFRISSYPEFLLGAENNIALILGKNKTFEFAYYCNGWSELNKIPGIENFYEAKEFVKRIIEEPIN